MKDSTAPTVDQQRLVRVIRCQDCKHAFDEPEDSEGRTPQPCEDIICPGCHRRKMRLWYVEVNQLIDGKWKTVPDANAQGHRRKMRLWYVEVNQLIDGKWKTVPDANDESSHG